MEDLVLCVLFLSTNDDWYHVHGND